MEPRRNTHGQAQQGHHNHGPQQGLARFFLRDRFVGHCRFAGRAGRTHGRIARKCGLLLGRTFGQSSEELHNSFFIALFAGLLNGAEFLFGGGHFQSPRHKLFVLPCERVAG